MENLADYKEIVDVVKAKGGEAFKRCYQCGLCDAVCPWNRVRDFSMRRIVREAAFGMTNIEDDEIWRCTTCGTCPQQCPRDVKQIESGVALRRIATEYGVFAQTAKPLRGVAASLAAEGNPLSEKRDRRADWAEGLAVPAFAEGMEILYFPCCYLAYDPRLKRVARATAALLNRAGVDYGILGTLENCCGESIRKAGDEELFRRLAKQNIKTFIDHGVRKILVSSPHCYQALAHDYAEFRVNFEVVHISAYLAELIAQGRLPLQPGDGRQIAYHDPCYLGRHNRLFDPPRAVLAAAAGGRAPTELPEARAASLCCGGGGGRIWMETHKGERFSDIRVRQAVAVGAEVLATACPYCISHFEESRIALENPDGLLVKDITELLAELL